MTEQRSGGRVDSPGLLQGIMSSPRQRPHTAPPYSKMQSKPYFFILLWLLSIVTSAMGVMKRPDHPCPSECRCDPALLKATCSGAGLSSVPKELPSSLQHLGLSNNNIRSIQIILPHLLTLNVSYNLISEWQFVYNISAPKLIILDLQCNNLETLPDQALSNFPNLKKVSLQYNKLKTVTLSALTNLPSLRHMDLGYNAIKGFDFTSNTNNLSHIHTLDLSNNMLSELSQREWFALLDVQLLNLSSNRLMYIPSASYHHNLTVAQHLLHNNVTPSSDAARVNGALSPYMNETYSLIYSIDENMNSKNRNIEMLDLSHNDLQMVHKRGFQHLHKLTTLHLNANKLKVLLPTWFEDLYKLEQLNLDANPIVYIPKRAFVDCSEMLYLTLSHMPNLKHIHYDAFAGLNNLLQLIVSNNSLLDYLHASTLTPLHSLQIFDISYGAIKTVFPDLLANASVLETFKMEGNPVDCGCDSKWIYQWINEFNNTMPKFHSPENITCASPSFVKNRTISDLDGFNFSCTPARIVNSTDYNDAMFKVGSPAVVDCVPAGDPQPRITWITPHGHMVLHHPAYVNWLRPGPHHHTFHANHPWHEGDNYEHDVPRSRRIYVLNNGSLYVDYMLRNDAGAYTCKVENPHGNETIIIHVRLDYSMFMFSIKVSMGVGFACALGFFCIAVLTAVLRYIAYFCSKEQRQKRKSISEILASLDQYRHDKIDRLSQYKSEKIDKLSQYKSEKFDKISAYKTEKFDKLSAFKSAKFDQLAQYKMAKVDKLRSYKNLSFSTLVHYIKGMREYYILQMVRIKENCTLQSEKLRENYSMKSCAFKDYRSHKLDAMRENYAIQVMKIKEYGSSQMAKLREQYRSQQNHILKLIELMDIGNCMHIVEAECMRTESMLFDANDLNFDFDTHPVHVPYFGVDDDNDTEYETAGSMVDINVPNKTKTRTQEQVENDQNDLEQLSVSDLAKKKAARTQDPKQHKQHKHRKQKRCRCRHKRPMNLPPFDDPDEEVTKSTKKKRRKLKEKKQTFHLYDDDTTAPDTPSELRFPASVYATVHNNDSILHSSEYDTASAHLHSRDVTPDSQGTTPPIVTPNTPVAGLADVGNGHNVVDFAQPRSVVTDTESDITPVHRPTSSTPSTPSTPTLTEEHVIIIDPTGDSEKLDSSSNRSPDMQSTV